MDRYHNVHYGQINTVKICANKKLGQMIRVENNKRQYIHPEGNMDGGGAPAIH